MGNRVVERGHRHRDRVEWGHREHREREVVGGNRVVEWEHREHREREVVGGTRVVERGHRHRHRHREREVVLRNRVVELGHIQYVWQHVVVGGEGEGKVGFDLLVVITIGSVVGALTLSESFGLYDLLVVDYRQVTLRFAVVHERVDGLAERSQSYVVNFRILFRNKHHLGVFCN